MRETVEIIQRDNCTGCSSCYNACPFKAIDMKLDKDGFLQPVVDKQKCIECGVCLAKCPVNNPNYENKEHPLCFAVSAENDVKQKSSSGGVFTVLAQHEIIHNGGYVCGAAMGDDNIAVEHKIVNKVQDITLMQGSKYVQSFTNNTYKIVEQLLKKDNSVLYTGTPCQIAGLYAYLGKQKYSKLTTVEIICHGVPSRKVLQKYIEELTQKFGGIKKIFFRTKDLEHEGGWLRSCTMKIILADGTVQYNERLNDVYLKAFLKALSMNKACKNCKFQKLPRQADITMGDFWGIENSDKEVFDAQGTSVVLINNEHGKEYFEKVKSDFVRVKEEPLETAINGNKQIIEAPWVNGRRDRFYSLLDKYPFSKAVDYGLNRRFEIGYVGWWYGANYGSVLTNFALHEVLTKKMDRTVLMISYPGTQASNESKSMRFARKHYEISMPRALEAHEDLNYYCEKFVLGSDQLWNWYSIRDTGHHFLLDWVRSNKKKIAYSTSFGHDRAFFPKDERMDVARLLHEFNSISVREKEGVDILRDEFGVDAVQLIDPVFLCEKEIYSKVADEVEPLCNEPYIYAYILDPTDEKREALEFLKNKLSKKALVVIDGQAENKDELVKIMGNDNVYSEVSIEQWLRLVRDADFVFTDSYHGTCFSIINKKPFITMKNRKRGNSRFDSLMDLLQLHDRIINSPLEIRQLEEKIFFSDSIDYNYVLKVIDDEKEKGINWLVDALDTDKNIYSYNSMIIDKIIEQEREIQNLKKILEGKK